MKKNSTNFDSGKINHLDQMKKTDSKNGASKNNNPTWIPKTWYPMEPLHFSIRHYVQQFGFKSHLTLLNKHKDHFFSIKSEGTEKSQNCIVKYEVCFLPYSYFRISSE